MATSTSSGTISLRPLASGLHASRGIAFAVFLLVLGAAGSFAYWIGPSYKADSTLLVMFGPEYTFRPIAGEPSMVNAMLDREQVLQTEISLLQQPDLERAVIAKIGVEQLYPALLRGPGAWSIRTHELLAQAWSRLHEWVPALPSREPVPLSASTSAETPDEQALRLFDKHLGMRAMKAGNTIELWFSHPDPAVAARVLQTLTALYLERRLALVTSPQAALIGQQAEEVRARLEAADGALAAFTRGHAIGGFETRRTILLQAQGALEADLQAASREQAESAARVQTARAQLAQAAPQVLQEKTSEVDLRRAPEAVRAGIDQLQSRLADQEAQSRPDSGLRLQLSQQLAAREAALARSRQDQSPSTWRLGRNPLVADLEAQIARSETERRAAEVRHVVDQQSLQDVATALASMTALEQQLDQLNRNRGVLEEQYKAAARLQEDRRISEEIEARKVPSVRVLQPALRPPLPEPTRRLIALAGACLAVLAGLLAATLGHLLRRTYLLPGPIEQDLGMSVLVCIPDSRAMHRLRLT